MRGGQGRLLVVPACHNIGVPGTDSETAPRSDRHQYPTPLYPQLPCHSLQRSSTTSSTLPISGPYRHVRWEPRAGSLEVGCIYSELYASSPIAIGRRSSQLAPSALIHTRTLTVVQNSPPAERCVNANILDQFLPCLRDFKNVENLILRDWWESPPLSEDRLKKYFGHFGARLRSLELNGEGMSSDFFLALLGLFPNLEDLFVDEWIMGVEESVAPAVSPKLSGRLTMGVHTPDLFPTLCEFPLRFREICLREGRCDYQKLINASAKTLVNFQVDVGLGRWWFEISSSWPNSSQRTYHATSPSGSAKRSGGISVRAFDGIPRAQTHGHCFKYNLHALPADLYRIHGVDH